MSKKQRKRSRVPSTFVAPHAAGPAPRCVACDTIVWTLEHRPQDIPIEKLAETRRAVETAAPPYGQMVRALADDVAVWACPRHNSLERIIGGTIHGGRTVEWRIVARTKTPA